MVKATLVEEAKAAGRSFLERVDKSGLDVKAALWTYREEGEYWRLVLASPLVDKAGSRDMYRKLHPIWLEQKDELDWSLITVVGTNEPLIKLIASEVNTGDGIGGFWFSARVIESTYVDDCYIYRMNL